MIELTVGTEYDQMRLDRFVLKASDIGKNTAEKLIRKGEVKVNGKKAKADCILQKDDIVRIYGVAEKGAGAVSFNEALGGVDVIYEDEFILAVNKPAFLPTQPMQGQEDCLSERVKLYLRKTIEEGGYRFVPAPVNRLDYETSGIVLCGKTPDSARKLSELLREEKIEKHYDALCLGEMSGQLRLENWAVKDQKENRMTLYGEKREGASRMLGIYRSERSSGGYSLVDARLITGKTHQIRSQMAFAGHPLVNDYKYGKKKENDQFREKYGIRRLFLHCCEVSFALWYAPGDIRITCDMPEEMKEVLKKLGM